MRRTGVEAEAARLGARFGLDLSGGLSGGTVPWSLPALARLEAVLSSLPPAAVRDNPALVRLVRVAGEGAGAYHDEHSTSPFGPRSIEIGVRRLHGPSRAYLVPIDHFGATVRHEIGHAVAARLGLWRTRYERVPGSPWVYAGDRAGLLRRLLSATGAEEDEALRLCEILLALPPGRGRCPGRALERLGAEARRRHRPGPPRSILRLPALLHLWQTSRYAMPCYHGLLPDPPALGGLVYFYDSGYQRGFICRAPQVRATRVSDYQFRSPDEWFAELYAVYYADLDRARGAGQASASASPGRTLRRLRRGLGPLADWMDANVR
jgi:hypothetical protein